MDGSILDQMDEADLALATVPNKEDRRFLKAYVEALRVLLDALNKDQSKLCHDAYKQGLSERVTHTGPV